MDTLRWMAAGVVGGAIGAGIWAGIVVATGYEVGWIAWGVGALVGLAVAAAAGRARVQQGDLPAIGAALIALVSVVAGKYVATSLLVHQYLNESRAEIGAELEQPFDDEFVISLLADELVEQEEAAGRTVVWPAGVDPEFAEAREDYPTRIWARAEAWWASMTPEQQRGYERDQRAQLASFVEADLDMLASEATTQGFIESFTLFDLLWFGLAGVTAFKLGAGHALRET